MRGLGALGVTGHIAAPPRGEDVVEPKLRLPVPAAIGFQLHPKILDGVLQQTPLDSKAGLDVPPQAVHQVGSRSGAARLLPLGNQWHIILV